MAPDDHLQDDVVDGEIPPPPPSPSRAVSSSSVTRRKSYLPKDRNPDEQRRKSKSKELRGSVNASLDSLFKDTGACMKPSSWLVLDLDDDTSVESFLTPTQSSRRKRLSSSSIPNSYVGLGNDSDSLISGNGRGGVTGGGRGTPKTRGIKSKQRSNSFSYGSKATASTVSSSSSLASGSSHDFTDKRRQSCSNHQLYDAKEVEKWASMELGLDYDDDDDEFEVSISSTGKDKLAPSTHKVDRKNLMQRQESWAVLQIDLGGTEDHAKSPGARNSRGRKITRSNSISHKKRDGSSSSRSSKQRSSSRSLSKSKRRASMGALASSGLRHSSSSSMLSSSSSLSGEKKGVVGRKLPGRTKSFEISRGPLVDRQSSDPSSSAAAAGVTSRKLPGRTKSFDISRLGPIISGVRQVSAESATRAGTSKAKVRNKSFEIKRHMF